MFIDSTNHQCTQLKKHEKNNILLIGSRKRGRGDEIVMAMNRGSSLVIGTPRVPALIA